MNLLVRMSTTLDSNNGANTSEGPDLNSRKVHPFFVAGPCQQPPSQSNPDPTTAETSPSSLAISSDAADEDAQRRKRRRTNSPPADPGPPAVKQLGRPKANSKGSKTAAIPAAPGFVPCGSKQTTLSDKNANILAPPLHSASASFIRGEDPGKPTQVPPKPAIPPKILQFNPKTGTIGSPPKPKPAAPSQATSAEKPAKRGRKRKGQILRVCYGDDDTKRTRIGQSIHQIIHGLERAFPKDAKSSSNRKNDAASIQPIATKDPAPKKQPLPQSKSTHPFFLGKPKAAEAAAGNDKQQTPGSSAKRTAIFTLTSGSASGRHFSQKPGAQQSGMGPGGLKVPGAQHPAWPWEGAVHVRGQQSELLANSNATSLYPMSQRKAKCQAVALGRDESILCHIQSDIDVGRVHDELRALNFNEFSQPPSSLRIPQRHFESGRKLQTRVARELSSPIAQKTHPAIRHAFDSILTSLPAFDRVTCENTAWAQKYTPQHSGQVLQGGREAELLRDWLQTLQIQAVDTGPSDAKAKTPMAPKKRRRKKLDDFIVSSDDDEMDELAEPAEGESPLPNPARPKKSVMKHNAKDGTRLTNSVLLSGPHGSGKTAAIYSVAKELDFEVFEISPGARRSGKDILEKVGDMTRNHLVQHQQKDETEASEPTDDEVSRDLKTGKQGMMTSFFKPKPEAKPAPKGAGEPTPSTAALPVLPAKTREPHSQGVRSQKQKQSLILLEEVDILYEEDKHFWATVISMVSQSKRPFIMTCNDESFVPLANLNLHGIFRFSSPPKDLATDLLVLIAANEGHAIRRQAIEALYDSRQHDLRASITELNYWCQIGVGDPRSGFSWFYPRWPKGNDVDENGDVIRVVSENTYLTGMGWLGRDPITMKACQSQEEAQRQAWESWSLDVYDPGHSRNFPSWAKNTEPGGSRSERLDVLRRMDDYAQAMSDTDLCSNHAFASKSLLTLDTTSPSLPSKIKEDFVIGRHLLEVSPVVKYTDTAESIAFTMQNLANSCLGGIASAEQSVLRCHSDEQAVTAALRQDFQRILKGDTQITRVDYSEAFDPLALSDKIMPTGYLDPSIFDRTMKMITLDVAPYVRSIVASDQRLQKERASKSSLVSEGGKRPKKRVRNTRSAFSALEGGSRASTRREKYFSADINPHLVLYTGGEGWGELGLPDEGQADEGQADEGQAAAPDSKESSDHSSDMDVDAGSE